MRQVVLPFPQTRTTDERLDLVESIFEFKKTPDLENVVIIGAQHILPSTLTMLNSFFERGLSPSNVFLIGKCYSTDLATYNELKDIGVYVCPTSLYFNARASFDAYYSLNIQSFIHRILQQSPRLKKQLIVAIDDGGQLIMNLQQFQRKGFSIVGLEQTTSGYKKIQSLDLNFGVVNVARSRAKLEYESKLVAKTAVSELSRKLLEKRVKLETVLIFGNGAIGKAVANALEGQFNVYIADVKPENAEILDSENLQDLSDFDLILGCVGQKVLSLEKIKKLREGTILASLSSSDREFEIVKLRREVLGLVSCHDDFTWNGINILNCGFPINFSGKSSDVDIAEFELTRSLLSLGILQAIESHSNKGLISLDESSQSKIIKKFSVKYSRTMK